MRKSGWIEKSDVEMMTFNVEVFRRSEIRISKALILKILSIQAEEKMLGQWGVELIKLGISRGMMARWKEWTEWTQREENYVAIDNLSFWYPHSPAGMEEVKKVQWIKKYAIVKAQTFLIQSACR